MDLVFAWARKHDVDATHLLHLEGELVGKLAVGTLDKLPDGPARYASWVEGRLRAACQQMEADWKKLQQEQQRSKEAARVQAEALREAMSARGLAHQGRAPSDTGRRLAGRLLAELQAGVAGYRGQDGKELCLSFLRQGYGHRDDSMDPPRCPGGAACGKAHARLPDGAVKVDGKERTWRKDMRETAVAVAK